MDGGDTYYRPLLEGRKWEETFAIFADAQMGLKVNCRAFASVVVGRKEGWEAERVGGSRGFKYQRLSCLQDLVKVKKRLLLSDPIVVKGMGD